MTAYEIIMVFLGILALLISFGDKAAVWVTNWDTERNGSSLTTRDGTSYLLANAFMLAYVIAY